MRQGGLPVPVGELQFAGGGNRAVDGGQQQVLPDGKTLMALGRENGIQQLDQIEALGDIEQRGDIAEGGHFRFQGLGQMFEPLGGGHEIVDFAEVDGTDDLGLAIDALAKAGVVIGVAADSFGGEARHK